MSDHSVTHTKETRNVEGKKLVRYYGRCSCGRQTHLHYSTAAAAESALRRTHVRDLAEAK